MMPTTATAPGKLVLTGEYAVLEGAPALVMAVDRRARVLLDDASDGYCIDASDLGIMAAHARLQANGDNSWQLRWTDVADTDAERLALVAAVLEACAVDGAPSPFHATLDTRFFFADDASSKLGLGSSAALAVALAGAIRARECRAMLPLTTLIDAHRRIQDGRGSGLDIAASLAGGLIGYQLHDGQPHVEALAWPTGLAWCCVWSGKSASTADFLRGLARWREEKTSYYAALMGELGTCSTSALAAVKADNTVAFIDAIAAYADGLARMSAASGLDIVSAEHRHIAAIAAAHDVAYKPCGAGGGDIGIALSTESGRLQGFRQDLAQAGIQSPGITLDAQGVRVN